MQRRIQLETILGFNGLNTDVLRLHPTDPNILVRAIGGQLVCSNLKTGEQRFVKLHDMEITCLALSPCGKYAITGQRGTIAKKHPEAPIVLTDLATLKPVHVFNSFLHGVLKLEFSEDGQFLAATGEDNRFIIWNMDDYTIVTSLLQERQYTQFRWLKKITTAKYPNYTFVASTEDKVFIWTLHFDLGSMKYFSKNEQVQLPSAGLSRTYLCNAKDATNRYYFSGTKGGELCVFDVDQKLFKASVQIGNTGITTLDMVDGYLLAGLSNGHFFKLQGDGVVWNVIARLELQSAILNISSHPTTKAVFVGTADCSIYFIDLANWKASIYSSGHTSAVVDLDVKGDINSGHFASIDRKGATIVWERNGNQMMNTFLPSTHGQIGGSQICFGDNNTVAVGFSDGSVKCFTMSRQSLVPKVDWEIPCAHKGKVSAMYMNQDYILTGGEDNLIRIWSRGNRKMINQINFHTKMVTKIMPDLFKPNLIHSCSMDKQVYSYDLKQEKKIMYHTAKNGHLLDMTQKCTPEFELVSVGFNNPIAYWDIDVVASTAEIPTTQKCNCIDMSPSGKYFLVGTEDCFIYCYDTNTKQVVAETPAHSEGLSKIKWTKDEKSFISSSIDGSVNVWKWC